MRAQLHALAQAMHNESGGRLIRLDHLHLTLVFLGNVARARFSQLEAIAQEQCGIGFNLEFGNTGYWRHNRIVWAAPISVPEPLRELVAELKRSLRQGGIQFDRRIYKNKHKHDHTTGHTTEDKNEYGPHITLIRDARAPAALPMADFGWRVTDFALIESARGANGAEYRVLGRWPLHTDQ